MKILRLDGWLLPGRLTRVPLGGGSRRTLLCFLRLSKALNENGWIVLWLNWQDMYEYERADDSASR